MSSDDCYDKAVDLLARRPHFRWVLERKLAARDFDSEEIESACDRLAASGLLDDLESARGLLRGSWRRKGFGPLRVRAELQERGVAGEIIDTVLSEIGGDDTERAQEVAHRWLRSRSKRSRDALARHLGRKGYSGQTIYEVLTRLEAELEQG